MNQRYHVCVCGNRLGESLIGGLEAQRHKGRRTLSIGLTQCEECARWSAPPDTVILLRRLGFDAELALLANGVQPLAPVITTEAA